jgi:hypothetical protein
MRNLGRLAFGIVVGVMAAAPARAQSRPGPLAEPVQWLAANLGGAACVVYEAGPSPFRMERVIENTEVQFDGCQMVLQQASAEGEHSEIRTFRIPLGALASSSVTASKGFFLPEGWMTRGDAPTHTIAIAVPGGQALITERVELFDGTTPRDERTGVVTILVRHEENASQIVRALARAIELCGEQSQAAENR